MKTGTNYFCVVAGLTLLCGWTRPQSDKMGKAEWLTGTWENKSSKGSSYETWRKVSDVELSGKSYILKGNDTLVFETIRLIGEGNNLFYIPTVKNQNKGLPVRFTAKSVSDTQLVFENAQHDFPQLISYTKTGADALIAEISGTKNGRQARQQFVMKRVK